MKLLFKQRFFSWFDSYDIFDEQEQTVFSVQGQLSWGHCLHIQNAQGCHIGTVKEKVLTFLPKFELFIGEDFVGEIRKELTFLRPRFTLSGRDWSIEGSVFEWDYQILDHAGNVVATIEKQLFHWTDTYVLDIANEQDALFVLMVVLAIDAAKCSQGS